MNEPRPQGSGSAPPATPPGRVHGGPFAPILLARRRYVVWLALLLSPALVFSAVTWAAAFPALLRIPRRHEGPPVRSLPEALFSHRSHQSFGCYACHPSVFPQAPMGFTHLDMRQGRFCGQCHDGHAAFAVQGSACGGCHVPAP